MTELLAECGFKLTKFFSNDPAVVDALSSDSIVPIVDGEKVVSEKVASPNEESSHDLGLRRDHNEDTLVVSSGLSQKSKLDGRAVTQRLVLSCVASVFDPIGLVAPFTMRAKLLLKEMWRSHG